MKVRMVLQGMFGMCFWLSSVVFAGDLTCYGNKSTTSHFACLSTGNCVWWTAYKRPDLAAARTGSGWNGGQWYDKFKALGFPVGSEPKASAIVEFSTPGHVAYVEKVYPDGSFDVSEMDAFGSDGFNPGVNYATYHPDGNGKYHRNNGTPSGWTLKGFIYYKEPCDPSKERCTLRVNGPVGWYPPVDNCQQATQWFNMFTINGEKVAGGSTTKAACPQVCYAN